MFLLLRVSFYTYKSLLINIVPLSHIYGYEVFVKCVILNVKFAVLHSSGADESKQLRDCKDAAVS